MAKTSFMDLRDYLQDQGLSLGEFARRIKVRNARTVQRYVKGLRTPTGPVMARIVEETGGKVMPNDFLLQPAE